MGLKDRLRKAYIDIPWDEEQTFRIPVTRSDLERVMKEGPDMVERLSKMTGEEPWEKQDAMIRDSLDFFCGEKVGGELYAKTLEYIGEGADGSECILQMQAVVDEVAMAWNDYLAEYRADHKRKADHYLKHGQR